jgi:hypothetical protein
MTQTDWEEIQEAKQHLDEILEGGRTFQAAKVALVSSIRRASPQVIHAFMAFSIENAEKQTIARTKEN